MMIISQIPPYVNECDARYSYKKQDIQLTGTYSGDIIITKDLYGRAIYARDKHHNRGQRSMLRRRGAKEIFKDDEKNYTLYV